MQAKQNELFNRGGKEEKTKKAKAIFWTSICRNQLDTIIKTKTKQKSLVAVVITQVRRSIITIMP